VVSFALVALVAASCVGAGPARGDEPTPTRRPMTVLEPGLAVDQPTRDRWNRIVLLATPKFSSGDTDAVSDAIRKTVSGFTLTILATVRPTGAARHELVEVGVGYSMPVKGVLTVVAPTSLPAGATLDFLGRQILSAKLKSLGDIECVGSHETAFAFDVPTLMLREGEHSDLVVRHLVHVEPRSGTCSSLAWLLAAGGDEPLRVIAAGTREDRPIHVDGSRFSFGFPTKQAFAVEDLPPGRRLDWPAALRESAGAAAYAPPELARLAAELDAAARRQGLLSAARDAGKKE
jgi:hypothetical protein